MTVVGGAAGGVVEDMVHAFWQLVISASQLTMQAATVCRLRGTNGPIGAE